MFVPSLLFFGIGGQEILIIALVVLLLFGGKKIPELMKGLGKGVKNFKDGVNGIENDINSASPDSKEAQKQNGGSKETGAQGGTDGGKA